MIHRNQREDSPSLNWSSLQHLLENAVPHVLIILDCCFAANAARDTTHGSTKEILAACGRENPTLGVGIRSFTSALIEELHAFGTAPFSVAMLYARLVTMRWRLAFTPIYLPLSESGGSSIQLSPLPVVDVPMDNISSDDIPGEYVPGGFVEDFDDNFTEGTPDDIARPLNRETRVLLAVSIAKNTSHDRAQWMTWLTSQAPSDVIGVNVQVESVFDGHSTLLIVSVPTCAWGRLPDNNAYQFVGFIKSRNLLPGLEGDVNASHSVQMIPGPIVSPEKMIIHKFDLLNGLATEFNDSTYGGSASYIPSSGDYVAPELSEGDWGAFGNYGADNFRDFALPDDTLRDLRLPEVPPIQEQISPWSPHTALRDTNCMFFE